MAFCETSGVLNPSTSCNQSEGMLKMVIFAKDGVSLATGSAASTKAAWDTLNQNKDIIVLPAAISTEPTNEGAVYEQTPLGSMWVRDGRQEMKLNINTNMDLHSKIRTLNNGGYNNVYYVYNSGVIAGTKIEGDVKFYPFALELLHIEYHTDNDGSVGGKTPVFISFADPTEFQDRPMFVKPTAFNPLRLTALKNAAIEVISASATSIVIDVFIPHIKFGLQNPIEGLVAGDFLLTAASGASQTISGAVEDSLVDGRYTLSGTGLVTGLLDLKESSAMTTQGYSSTGTVAITIA